MSNITYMKDFIDKRNELDDSIETEGMKVIRKNMKEWGKRQRRVNKIREEENKRANPVS